ncbi:MAG: hypothetical protein J2P49_08100, partial [Methylocapsa sp.]|nr:hypothetical protein [Methylocapsa sp.]
MSIKSGFDPPDNAGFILSSRGGHYRRGGVAVVKDAIGRLQQRPLHSPPLATGAFETPYATGYGPAFPARAKLASLITALRSPGPPPSGEGRCDRAVAIKSRHLHLYMTRLKKMTRALKSGGPRLESPKRIGRQPAAAALAGQTGEQAADPGERLRFQAFPRSLNAPSLLTKTMHETTGTLPFQGVP